MITSHRPEPTTDSKQTYHSLYSHHLPSPHFGTISGHTAPGISLIDALPQMYSIAERAKRFTRKSWSADDHVSPRITCAMSTSSVHFNMCISMVPLKLDLNHTPKHSAAQYTSHGANNRKPLNSRKLRIILIARKDFNALISRLRILHTSATKWKG